MIQGKKSAFGELLPRLEQLSVGSSRLKNDEPRHELLIKHRAERAANIKELMTIPRKHEPSRAEPSR